MPEILYDDIKYLKRLAKGVLFGTTWWQRLIRTAIPVDQRIFMLLRAVAKAMKAKETPEDLKFKLYRDKYEMAKKVYGVSRVGPYGFYTHYDKTIHLSVEDADDKVVAHECARAMLHHIKGKKPSSAESLAVAIKVRKEVLA